MACGGVRGLEHHDLERELDSPPDTDATGITSIVASVLQSVLQPQPQPQPQSQPQSQPPPTQAIGLDGASVSSACEPAPSLCEVSRLQAGYASRDQWIAHITLDGDRRDIGSLSSHELAAERELTYLPDTAADATQPPGATAVSISESVARPQVQPQAQQLQSHPQAVADQPPAYGRDADAPLRAQLSQTLQAQPYQFTSLLPAPLLTRLSLLLQQPLQSAPHMLPLHAQLSQQQLLQPGARPERANGLGGALVTSVPAASPACEPALRWLEATQLRGISKRVDRWIAYVSVGRQKKHIGSFLTDIEAARAYDDYVVLHQLDYELNFPVDADATGVVGTVEPNSSRSGAQPQPPSQMVAAQPLAVDCVGRTPLQLQTSQSLRPQQPLASLLCAPLDAQLSRQLLPGASPPHADVHGGMPGVASVPTALAACEPAPIRCPLNRFRGIDARDGRWRARIRFKGEEVRLGYFPSAVDAALAYDDYVVTRKLVRALNFPPRMDAAQLPRVTAASDSRFAAQPQPQLQLVAAQPPADGFVGGASPQMQPSQSLRQQQQQQLAALLPAALLPHFSLLLLQQQQPPPCAMPLQQLKQRLQQLTTQAGRGNAGTARGKRPSANARIPRYTDGAPYNPRCTACVCSKAACRQVVTAAGQPTITRCGSCVMSNTTCSFSRAAGKRPASCDRPLPTPKRVHIDLDRGECHPSGLVAEPPLPFAQTALAARLAPDGGRPAALNDAEIADLFYDAAREMADLVYDAERQALARFEVLSQENRTLRADLAAATRNLEGLNEMAGSMQIAFIAEQRTADGLRRDLDSANAQLAALCAHEPAPTPAAELPQLTAIELSRRLLTTSVLGAPRAPAAASRRGGQRRQPCVARGRTVSFIAEPLGEPEPPPAVGVPSPAPDVV